jgi:CRISPR/Cas system-associated protein Cas7 (RAMP superfamily)
VIRVLIGFLTTENSRKEIHTENTEKKRRIMLIKALLLFEGSCLTTENSRKEFT